MQLVTNAIPDQTVDCFQTLLEMFPCISICRQNVLLKKAGRKLSDLVYS